MKSSNGNFFRIIGPLCAEFTGDQWVPLTKASDAELWCFLWSAPWINSWVNSLEAGDLRCHHAHYDVIVMWFILSLHYTMIVNIKDRREKLNINFTQNKYLQFMTGIISNSTFKIFILKFFLHWCHLYVPSGVTGDVINHVYIWLYIFYWSFQTKYIKYIDT